MIPFGINPLWEVSPFEDATGNTPPFIGICGNRSVRARARRARARRSPRRFPNPLALTVWVADDAKAPLAGHTADERRRSRSAWSKFRGPGAVTFANERPAVEKADFPPPPSTVFSGRATTTATFSEPGEYMLRVVANDGRATAAAAFSAAGQTRR